MRRVIEGALTIVPRTKDLLYSPAGHNLSVDEDAEIIMFSSGHVPSVVIAHMIARVSA